jgi:ATP-binding cassette subfamily B protein
VKSTTSSTSSLKRLLSLNRPHWKRISLAALFVLLVNGALLLQPLILKVVIDDFLTQNKPQHGLYSLEAMGVAYFLVVLASGVFSILQVNLINRVGQEIMRGLRTRVFKTIQLLPLRSLDRTSTGSLITRATNDVEALSELYTNVLLSLFQDVFLILGIVGAMLLIDARLAIASLCVVPFMFGVIFLLRAKIKKNFQKVKHLIGRINGFMAENLSGMKLIQAFGAEKEKKSQFKELNGGYFKATLFQVRMNSILRPLAEVFQTLTVALLIAYGMGRVGAGTLGIGVLYAFTTYVRQFFSPVSDIADNYTGIQSAFVSADRIFELLDQKPDLEDLDAGLAMPRLLGDIEFRHVWFAYNGEEWVLRDVSFAVHPGETVAFVGETGAGKTTLISLVCAFYAPQKGEILIDGIPVDRIRKRDLRRNISVVLQDVFLFSETIGRNISLNDDIGSDEIEEALSTSYAHVFVDELPGRVDEPVMERGSTLSAGQRQLLSFARAIAHDPAVIVLDEATANIDTRTEGLIQKAIENIAKDRTTLVIAHRLSTIRRADRIIVMKDGAVAESGSHEELMAAGGYYLELVQGGEARL